MKNSLNCGTEQLLDGQNDIDRPQAGSDETLADDILLNRLQRGDMDAFGLLVRRYQDRLFNTVLRMVGNYDDALDLTQETFVRALKGAKKFRRAAGFYTWLFRIGVNLCINHRKRQKSVQFSSLSGEGEDAAVGRQADGLAGLVASDGPSPVNRAELNESHRRVLGAIERLEPDSRAIVILRDVEGLNYAEIGRILEVPLGTVKSRLARARLAIRQMLPGH